MFSDGVFAIAITLLVLELPFARVGHGDLANALGERWPTFAAYIVSFGGIGMAWLHHNAIFDQVVKVDRALILLNLCLLLTIAFLPFPTALLGEYIRQSEDAQIAALMYSGAWTLASAAMTALWTYACRHPELLARDLGPDAARRMLRYLRAATIAYAVFTLMAVVSPYATLALYGATAVFLISRSDYQVLDREPVTGEPPSDNS
jgi:TMEM175 potassium channel family protein